MRAKAHVSAPAKRPRDPVRRIVIDGPWAYSVQCFEETNNLRLIIRQRGLLSSPQLLGFEDPLAGAGRTFFDIWYKSRVADATNRRENWNYDYNFGDVGRPARGPLTGQ